MIGHWFDSTTANNIPTLLLFHLNYNMYLHYVIYHSVDRQNKKQALTIQQTTVMYAPLR